MIDTPMMACGHAANATRDGKPCCVICIGLNVGADVIAEAPDLTGRMASCPNCSRQTPSSPNLAFFAYRPTAMTDSHYCGCRGWD
jgi:hypothetical protein